jgi:hypothetical protein
MSDAMDLDNILENDLIDALGDLNAISTDTTEPVVDDITINETIVEPTEEKTISINSASGNIDNIANLLKELLDNKTIEITIKIKDN